MKILDHPVSGLTLGDNSVLEIALKNHGKLIVSDGLKVKQSVVQGTIDYCITEKIPLSLEIENNIITSILMASCAVIHGIEETNGEYRFSHAGDGESGVFYLPIEDDNYEQMLSILKESFEKCRSICYQEEWKQENARLEYQDIRFLDEI